MPKAASAPSVHQFDGVYEEDLRFSGFSGGKLVHDSLVENGVDTVFGYSGGANLPILDQFSDSPMRFIVNRSEQCCGHAAEGYARSSGKVGVVLTTSGPGLTNIITPLQAATTSPSARLAYLLTEYVHAVMACCDGSCPPLASLLCPPTQDARGDSTPIVALSGQVPTAAGGPHLAE